MCVGSLGPAARCGKPCGGLSSGGAGGVVCVLCVIKSPPPGQVTGPSAPQGHTVTNKSRPTGTCHHASFLTWYQDLRLGCRCCLHLHHASLTLATLCHSVRSLSPLHPALAVLGCLVLDIPASEIINWFAALDLARNVRDVNEDVMFAGRRADESEALIRNPPLDRADDLAW